jgi:hypothetical protein
MGQTILRNQHWYREEGQAHKLSEYFFLSLIVSSTYPLNSQSLRCPLDSRYLNFFVL